MRDWQLPESTEWWTVPWDTTDISPCCAWLSQQFCCTCIMAPSATLLHLHHGSVSNSVAQVCIMAQSATLLHLHHGCQQLCCTSLHHGLVSNPVAPASWLSQQLCYTCIMTQSATLLHLHHGSVSNFVTLASWLSQQLCYTCIMVISLLWVTNCPWVGQKPGHTCLA